MPRGLAKSIGATVDEICGLPYLAPVAQHSMSEEARSNFSKSGGSECTRLMAVLDMLLCSVLRQVARATNKSNKPSTWRNLRDTTDKGVWNANKGKCTLLLSRCRGTPPLSGQAVKTDALRVATREFQRQNTLLQTPKRDDPHLQSPTKESQKMLIETPYSAQVHTLPCRYHRKQLRQSYWQNLVT